MGHSRFSESMPSIDFASDPSNAAPEWQARNLGWQSRERMVACPLEELVRRVAVEANV